jgi:hypothetical protein
LVLLLFPPIADPGSYQRRSRKKPTVPLPNSLMSTATETIASRQTTSYSDLLVVAEKPLAIIRDSLRCNRTIAKRKRCEDET